VSRESRAVYFGAVGLVTGLAAAGSVLAVHADLAANLRIQLVALDTTVGLGFCVGAMIAQGSRVQRDLVLLTGLSWIAGSVWVQTASVHRGVLALALWTFPTGEFRRWSGWCLLTLCLIVSLGTVSQPGVAALFAVVSLAVILRSRRRGAVGFPGYSVFSAALLAVLLGTLWLAGLEVDPSGVAVAYDGAMLVIGLTFPFAMHAELRRRESLADAVLGESELPLLEGLATTLRRLLGDDTVQVYRWHPAESAYVDGRGDRLSGEGSTGRRLDVRDASGPLAALVHGSDALKDPPTARAVVAAVRLTVLNLRLQELLSERLDEMQAARRRMVESIDRERRSMSAALDRDVERALNAARGELSQVSGSRSGPDVAEAVSRLHEVLREVSMRMTTLVSGTAPAALGGGRLVEAVADLTATCPIPVTVTVSGEPAADLATETALFFLCSEGLTNAIKHARATRIMLKLASTAEAIVVTLTDDGVGGADAFGSGLRGLSDRLGVCGGRLQVVSHPGDGTTLTATVPI
jgi:signal transduction histidine kinase